MAWKCPPLHLPNWNNLWKWKESMRPDGITQDYLKQVFTYDNGNLYWKIKHSDNINIGDIVGCIKKNRRYTKINYKDYSVSRLIFMYHNGYFPTVVDHINGDSLDNRIENLRGCNNSQNQYNSKKPKHNTSGIKNVQWYKERKKWRVQICVNNKTITCGLFDDLELAELVALEARLKYHKEFANHGN